ncbi:MAG: amino acid ABC transporter permease [Propionibacteriaceae bacterium]|jgi:cystine transport system permease protein|nr:amino acid ABC transporter permease [Propionibacteriaceae bacterium]
MTQRSWELVCRAFWPLIESTLTATIPLALCSFAIGLALALVVALAKLSPIRIVSLLGTFYVSAIRGTPLLVQLYIIFYGLPFFGVTLPTFPSAIIALSANVGGYAAEAIRGAILAVPRGQWEAATTIGLDYWKTLRRVVLPQALRIAVPPLSNTFISLVKDTSLCSVVMVTELVRRAQIFATPAYDFLPMYVEAALIYWPICTGLSFAQKRLEVRLGEHVSA